MKKLFSILTLSVLLYSMFSPGIALLYFEKEFSQVSEVTEGDEWIEVKYQISLPYTSDFINASPQNTLHSYNGEFYNVVEQRYENDTLVTKLKTNRIAGKRFKSLADEILAQVNGYEDEPSSPLGHVIELFKNIFSKYMPSKLTVVFADSIQRTFSEGCVHFSYTSFLSEGFVSISSPPPQS